MNYLQFCFKGPKYIRNIVFSLLIFLQIFSNIKKSEWLFFSRWIFVESIEFQWSVSVSELCIQLVNFSLSCLRKRDADLWLLIFEGYTQKKNCMFPFKNFWMGHGEVKADKSFFFVKFPFHGLSLFSSM